MEACIYVVQYGRLHLRFLQGWMAEVCSPKKHCIDILVQVSSDIISPLDWWLDPTNVCRGVPFTPTSALSYFSQRCLRLGLGGSPGTPIDAGSLVAPRFQSTYKHQRAVGCLFSIPSLHQGKELIGSDQQCKHHVLCKQAGRGSILTALSGRNTALGLLHQQLCTSERGPRLGGSEYTGRSSEQVVY